MRIAITMQSLDDLAPIADPSADTASNCFAEFEVDDGSKSPSDFAEQCADEEETVQVTVVLRGKREELENPALGMTNLILSALRTHRAGNTNHRSKQVIDAMGLAVETAC